MSERKQKTLKETLNKTEEKKEELPKPVVRAEVSNAPSWLRDTFGIDRVIFERRDLIGDDRLEGHEVVFEQPEPDVVRTKFGRRVMIDARVSGEPLRVVIGHVNFAIQIARLQRKYGSLLGVRIRVRKVDKSRKPYQFEIEDLGVVSNHENNSMH